MQGYKPQHKQENMTSTQYAQTRVARVAAFISDKAFCIVSKSPVECPVECPVESQRLDTRKAIVLRSWRFRWSILVVFRDAKRGTKSLSPLTQNLVISCCCFAEDGKEMYQEL